MTLNGLILEKIETIPESNISINLNNYVIETVLIKDNMIKFLETLDDDEDVQNIFTNAKFEN